MDDNPYRATAASGVSEQTSKRAGLGTSVGLAAACLLSATITVAAIAAFFWAFLQYPVMGRMLGAPPVEVLQTTMLASFLTAVLGALGAGMSGYGAIRRLMP
jgi:hypothetical protein